LSFFAFGIFPRKSCLKNIGGICPDFHNFRFHSNVLVFSTAMQNKLKTPSRPRVDFINVLCTAFTPVAPQSIRTQSSCQYLFTPLGSTFVKAVPRTMMKLSPGVNFINILLAPILYKRALRNFSLVTFWLWRKDFGKKVLLYKQHERKILKLATVVSISSTFY
jgi:hypothetical protein